MEIKIKNRILIITAVWQRHELTEIVLFYYGKLAARSKGKISLLAVGSEGDRSKVMCENNGWKYIERSNDPVSYKWSALTEEAKNMDFDFIIIVGSDDLLSLSLIKYYDKVYSRDTPYMLGLTDLYFYMIRTKKSYHFHGYPSLKTIGAGRCISRSILERVNWRPWHTYTIQRGLDSRCSSHLNRMGVKEVGVRMADTRGVAIDIKHTFSITDPNKVIDLSSESDNVLKNKFPEEYEKIIKC